jgi:hypothetical protein
MRSIQATPLMGSVKYQPGKDFRQIVNESLTVFFKDALRVSLKDPSQALAFVQTLRNQRQAARIT